MIKMTDVCKAYQPQSERPVKIFENFHMAVNRGEMAAVTGRSGSGKSTLLAIIAGLLPIDSGEYYFLDQKIAIKNACEGNRFRRKNIGVVVQNFALISDMNVIENVLLALSGKRESKRDKREKAMQVLEALDLQGKAKNYPGELSGGQRQRAAIARAIITNPPLLIADEPTGALDEETEENVMLLLEKLWQSGMTILIATHNPDIAGRCQRTIHIQNIGSPAAGSF